MPFILDELEKFYFKFNTLTGLAKLTGLLRQNSRFGDKWYGCSNKSWQYFGVYHRPIRINICIHLTILWSINYYNNHVTNEETEKYRVYVFL